MIENTNRMVWMIIGAVVSGLMVTWVVINWDLIMEIVTLLFQQKRPLF